MASELFLIMVLAILVSVICTPFVIRFSTRIGAIDQPGERKIHSVPIPRLGGVAVFISFVVSILFALQIFPTLFSSAHLLTYQWYTLTTALLLVVGLGIWDDFRSLQAKHKFIVQLLIGTLVYIGGVKISSMSVPIYPGIIHLGVFAYPVTVLWIVGITNAFNLIDGLDGLAGGVAIIAAITIFAVAGLSQDYMTATIAIAIAGSVLGFLPFNFNPARIFLGDSGSLLLGFTLSIISIHSSTKGSTAVSILVPVLALGLPIMDTLLSMIRRLIKSFTGNLASTGAARVRSLNCIFLPDREHIHHRLLTNGLSHRTAVIILYLISCAFGICALAVTTRNINVTAMLIVIGTCTAIGVRKLGYQEMALFKSGMLLPLYNKPFIRRRYFHVCLDLTFMISSFYASYIFTRDDITEPSGSTSIMTAVILCCLIQMIVTLCGNTYKGTILTVGLGDILHMVKTVITAVLISAVFLIILFPEVAYIASPTFWILDFYFLFSLMTGMRVSFHVLNYIFRREQKGGKKILIYGANPQGLLTLNKILAVNKPMLEVVGFLDDDPSLEGKSLNGYPIFGGHWKLDAILRNTHAREIIVSSAHIKPEAIRRMSIIAHMHGVQLQGVRSPHNHSHKNTSTNQHILAARTI